MTHYRYTSPARPVHLAFTGALTNQDFGFLVLLSKIILLGSIRALADVKCHFWTLCRWSTRLTPGRLWVYLVVRKRPELTWLLLNGWKILGNSFYTCLVFLAVNVSCKGGKTQTQNQTKRGPQTTWTCTEIVVDSQNHPQPGYIISCLCHCHLVDHWLMQNKVALD